MEPLSRQFFDAVEYWAGEMTYGTIASLDAFNYVYEQFRPHEQECIVTYLRELPYKTFLKTRYWYAVRLKIQANAGGRCALCGSSATRKEIHRETYEHRGSEHLHLQDLQLLCDRCHGLIHATAKVVAQEMKQGNKTQE